MVTQPTSVAATLSPGDRSARMQDLQRRFAGRIDARKVGKDVIPSEQAVFELMEQWNPIRYSVEDVKAIMGAPSRETAESLEYRFDNGMEATLWRFSILGGRIIGLTYIPGD